jgi:hypothetical protein
MAFCASRGASTIPSTRAWTPPVQQIQCRPFRPVVHIVEQDRSAADQRAARRRRADPDPQKGERGDPAADRDQLIEDRKRGRNSAARSAFTISRERQVVSTKVSPPPRCSLDDESAMPPHGALAVSAITSDGSSSGALRGRKFELQLWQICVPVAAIRLRSASLSHSPCPKIGSGPRMPKQSM